MEGLEHSVYVADLFNKLFGKPILALLGLLGIEPKNPHSPVPDYLVMVIIVALLLIILLGLASRKLSLIPSSRQSFLETILQAFESILTDIIGETGKKYLPMIGTIGLFIFCSNMLGLVPGFMSPTSKLNVTAGCALAVFVYYHWQGIKAQGPLRYLKHFTGPIPALAPLLLPIEIISHFSRPVSLSLRLFGNIFAEELLIVIIASIVPFVLPLPFMAVAIFTAVIQSFVFVLLACIYIAGAVIQEEEH
jgi:F-type H+-transporting ATPase subunit a